MLLNCGVEEDSWENPLDCKEIKLVHPKGNQSWILIGRTDVEAETTRSKLREFVQDREACSPWGHKKSDMTERLNWTELIHNAGVDPTGVLPQGSEGRVTVITPRPEGKRGDTYSKPEERIL